METRKTILVAEDEPEVRSYLEMALRCYGYSVELAENGEEALACLEASKGGISLVLLDIIMPRKDGMETLREIRQLGQELPVIMLSGMSSPFKVVEAVKTGATDFLAKPVTHEDLVAAIRKALQGSDEIAPVPECDAEPNTDSVFFVRSAAARKIEAAIQQIAASDVPVLLEGETGAGKEILARQLHALSPRANKPFLKVNCAALPSELVESELFGYDRGAFTGAFKNKPGKFEMADGGTLLLDEIGDMDFKLQAKLLQVLQDNQFERLGGKESVRVNVRVLAATHCDLQAAIVDNRFREDLYYRLNVVSIRVPALRERPDEIIPLAEFLLKKHLPAGATAPPLTPALKQALLLHDWPGNIRELENLMRKLLVLRDPNLLVDELKHHVRRRPQPCLVPFPSPRTGSDAQPSNGVSTAPTAADVLTMEETMIRTALQSAHGDRNVAATLLRMDLQNLLRKMREFAIEAPPPAQSIYEPANPKSILEHVDEVKKQSEVEAILAALNASRWNRKQAARLLNIDYKALLYRMRKLAIEETVTAAGAGQSQVAQWR